MTSKRKKRTNSKANDWTFKIVEVDGPEAEFDIEESLADLLIDMWSKVKASDGSDTNWYRALCKINEFLIRISIERGGDGGNVLSESLVLYFEFIENDYEAFPHHRFGHRQTVPLSFISEKKPPNPNGATGKITRIHPSCVRVFVNAC